MGKPKTTGIGRTLEHWDVRIGKATARLREHRAVRVICAVGELADQPPLQAASVATLAAGLAFGDGRLARTGLRMLVAHTLATGAKAVIKHRVDRRRPHVDDGDHRLKPGKVVDEGPHNSFPSGHSAGAVAVARAVVRDHPMLARPAALAAGFASVAQLPAARHFPLDVTVGVAIGLAAEAIATILIPPDPRPPGEPTALGAGPLVPA